MSGPFRFVVCVDIEAESLEDAYRKLRSKMDASGFGWETSDEAYYPDGGPVHEQDLSETISLVIELEEEDK